MERLKVEGLKVEGLKVGGLKVEGLKVEGLKVEGDIALKATNLKPDHLKAANLGLSATLRSQPANFQPAFQPKNLPYGNAKEQQANLTVSTLLKQGKGLYDSGRFAEAVDVLEQALESNQTQGDQLSEAMVLSNLSLAYQQLGLWNQAKNAIANSEKLLRSIKPTDNSTAYLQVMAQSLMIKGSIELGSSEAKAAMESWEQAAVTYGELGDEAGEIRSRINIAQALQELGLYKRALNLLNQVEESLVAQPDSLNKAIGLRSLGNMRQLVGELSQSRETLEKSLEIARSLPYSQEISAILFSLGNTARAQQELDEAINYYQQAFNESRDPITKLEAQLNQLSLLIDLWSRYANDSKRIKEAQGLIHQIKPQLESLPLSRRSIYLRINFAQSLRRAFQWASKSPLGRTLMKDEVRSIKDEGYVQTFLDAVAHGGNPQDRTGSRSWGEPPRPRYLAASLAKGLQASVKKAVQPSYEIAKILATAVQQAKALGDKRAEAYALGSLGQLYEQNQQLPESQDLTQQALKLAQEINAPDISYRWQWQLGRILKLQGEEENAIAAYTEAVNTLKSLRSDLVAVNQQVRFTFRESVEPVYREFVQLLLQSDSNEANPDNLEKAREVIESLQLAELDNYFRSACLNATPVVIDQVIDQVDTKAALIYPIILPESLDIIIRLPQQPLRHYRTELPQDQIESTLEDLRYMLPQLHRRAFLPMSQQVYNWVIRPIEEDLANSQVDTLVFVLDGALRNIPMAALHDGKQYLVEKYSIALTPGLDLMNPQRLVRENIKVLTAGLSESRRGYPALPFVEVELEKIKAQVPSEILLNQDFTETSFENSVEAAPFPVVHIASHGQFSSEAEKTFIMTWDSDINVTELKDLLQTTDLRQATPIELLVLSACETATGDKRAALGIAGVAIEAGARSTLATIWAVNDEATAVLMNRFYQELTDKSISKAEALNRAQKSILQDPNYEHPFYWAAYIMVGNWL
ncbi:CHAT domain-containing protein [Moorena producens JHB]|uniref:CHAT domain-containing protein n=1 Tax=Moorena producens (strain JHB) TaxID=1454205 RepID=A0A1D9GAX8_MOOP1|nr:CHAT domain-containing protein [Moorena producens]AOY84625.2 CHAT domain-containing protein [Moorena producens JHB]